MSQDMQKSDYEPGGCSLRPRLSAPVFYSVIIMGVILGIMLSVAAGWTYLQSNERKPTGRRIWEADAANFVIPICVMVGATFGGLAGVASAVLLEKLMARRPTTT